MIKRYTILLGLALIITSIDQTCTNNKSCPNQSQCSSNNFCICQGNFIGNCSTSATPLSSTTINSTITSNTTTLYSTIPQQLDRYIEFTYTICQNGISTLILVFTWWGQNGSITQYNSATSLISPIQATLGSSCIYAQTPYIKFGDQPNGQKQMLILGITDNSQSSSINISVSQRVVIGFLIYYYILIGLGAFVVLFLFVGGAIFIARRRRLRALAAANPNFNPNPNGGLPETNDISHFQTVMPSFKGISLGTQKNICPVCLMQIQKNELIRKTPCEHYFHVNCIDSWGLKNLNCPVCRCDLSLQKINEKLNQKKQQSSPIYHQIVQQQTISKRSIEQPKILIQQNYEIRQNML